jgi:sn-glycerol 3-phosphate transport system ATP-binding protein
MVFQSYALFPHLSVHENILFGLKIRRVPRAARNARLAKTAELLGLTPLLDRKPAQLSGGQQQRVALARAIIAETPVCLMDEPLSNLDAQLRAEMRRELRALQQRLGMTVIYVTHDQVEAMTMADQIILMNAAARERVCGEVCRHAADECALRRGAGGGLPGCGEGAEWSRAARSPPRHQARKHAGRRKRCAG